MANFVVTKIIDGNTIEVTPGWKIGDIKGNQIKIRGYLPYDADYDVFASDRLKNFLLLQIVQLKDPASVINQGVIEMLLCSVYLNGVDVSRYFPDMKSPNPYAMA